MSSSRLVEKLKKLGLSAEDSPTSALKTPTASKKKLTFRIYFPLPPFDGIHFNALKAGQGAYNFTGLLLGVGGRQLQKIKQDSNARVEVVNAYGNLHGLHPDPLDEDLHALITADSMVKLQRAVDLVVQVLSPTNASFEDFRMEPGGSTRLAVAQPIKSKAVKPKVANHQHSSSSRQRASLDGSSSSCSTKGMPASPALTPVTPAATGSRHGSMFAPGSTGPNSCCSSRAPTPGPTSLSRGAAEHVAGGYDDLGGCCSGRSSGDCSSKDTDSHLEGFMLPPAALPSELHIPTAAEEWPALPSSKDSSSNGRDTSTAVSSAKQLASSTSAGQSDLSSSDSSGAGSEASSCRSSEASSGRSTSCRSDDEKQPGTGCAVLREKHMHDEACGSLQQAASAAEAAGVPAGSRVTQPVQPPAQPADRGSGAAVFGWAGSMERSSYTELAPASITVTSTGDVAAALAEHSMLSPLTPQAQQHHHCQQRQQGPHQHQQQQASELVLCSAGCTPGSGEAFSFGVSWDSSSMGLNSLDGLPMDAPHTTSQFVQPAGPLDWRLDLHSLRQYSSQVAQACLHCDVPGVSAGPCAGVAASCMLSHPYAMTGDSPMMGPSAGFGGASGLQGAGGMPLAADLQSAGLAAAGGTGLGLPATGQYSYADDQQRQQHEQHMRMVAESAASVYRSSDGGGSVALRSSCTGGQDALPAWQPGSLPSSWEFTHYASAQTAAVAAAASSAFGTSGSGVDGLVSSCWGGGAGSLGALTSSSFLTTKSIW